jgi:hypothetical protein
VEINELLVPFGKHVCMPMSAKCSACPVEDRVAHVGKLLQADTGQRGSNLLDQIAQAPGSSENRSTSVLMKRLVTSQ